MTFLPGIRRPLTPREWDVLRLTATGAIGAARAAELGMSVQTLKNHLSDIYHKLDVTNAIEAFVAMGWLYVPRAEVGRLYQSRSDLASIEAEARLIVARARQVADDTEAFADGLVAVAS